MAVASDRKRVQVTLSRKVLDDIDKLCRESGMSRSAWIEYTLTMGVHSYERILDGLSQAMARTASGD